MDVYLKWAVVAVCLLVVLARIVRKFGAPKDDHWDEEVVESPPPLPQQAGKLRLTDTQQVALSSASLGYTLYAEGRSQLGPDEVEIYSPRTIDSLVKRGFLEENGHGGYVITQAGADGYRSSCGF